MKRRLLTAAIVLATPLSALAQDKSILNDKDDIEFARALVAARYQDLAERLLAVVEKHGKFGDAAKSEIAAIKLDVAQDTATKLDDPVQKKDALVKVLADKEKFIEEFKGKEAAEHVRNMLPDLYNLIGEAITAALKKIKDEKALEALRTQGNAIFEKAEQAMKNRIAELKAIAEPTPEDEEKLQAASYNYPHTIYFHSLLYPAGSAQRVALCKAALVEYDEFDLNYGDGSSLLSFYAYIDSGLCLKETSTPDEAIKLFEKTIDLRQSWGPKSDKGVWPIPPNARDVVDIVCYGLLQKAIVLRDQKKPEEVVKLGKEYFTSIDKPFDAQMSMLLAKELCEAQIATSDKGAPATAKMMIDEDPNGMGGFLGRELVEKMGGAVGTPWTDKAKTAEQKLAGNEHEKGIAIARQILSDTAGTPDEQAAGAAGWLLIGFSYQKRGWFEEAALAYETGVNRFPKGEGAAELLSRAIGCYTSANGRASRKFYREIRDALMDRLVRDYPKAPQAADITMTKAQALDSEGDHLGAIALYEKIDKASTNYTKARLLIGIAWFNRGLTLSEESKKALEAKQKAEEAKKPDDAQKADAEGKRLAEEAKKAFGSSETAFKFAIDAIAAQPSTMDQKIKDAYNEQSFLCHLSLAKLYMLEAFGRAADASPVIDQLESKWAKDPKKGPEIQNLRGRLFLSQGKVEEAEKWVDELAKRDPKAAAGPAGQLARALDAQGLEKFKAKAESMEGDQIWARAARFYWVSIEPQVSGTATQNADEMSQVGNRFYVYGLHFNAVPDARISFVDWVPGNKRAPDYWVKAARIYEAAFAQNPAYRMAINLGRTYGFLGKWTEASATYARLFDQEQVVDQKDKRKLDRQVMGSKGELVMAYVEWGVAERMAAAAAGGDKARLDRSLSILTVLSNTLKPETLPEAYWASNYQLVRVLIDRGNYKDAQLSIDNTKRQVSETFDDDKYGYKKLFLETIDELKKK